jgi:hypothetical protein
VRTDLAACVPTVARWSFASLPKFLPASAIQRVLDHVDQQGNPEPGSRFNGSLSALRRH